MTNEKQGKTKEALDQKTKRILHKPETMETIFKHVAGGGSVVDLADLWGIRYCDILFHIYADAHDQTLYKEALFARNEWVARGKLPGHYFSQSVLSVSF